MYRYNSTSKTAFTFTKDASDYAVTMSWVTGPSGYPSPRDYAEGDLKNKGTGAVVGRFKMGWVSEAFRKCSVEIDTVAGSERPLDSGAGQDWASVFKTVGFDINVIPSDIDVAEESGESRNETELHKAMLDRRRAVNFDTDWPYYILAVKKMSRLSASCSILIFLDRIRIMSLARVWPSVPTSSRLKMRDGARNEASGSGLPKPLTTGLQSTNWAMLLASSTTPIQSTTHS